MFYSLSEGVLSLPHQVIDVELLTGVGLDTVTDRNGLFTRIIRSFPLRTPVPTFENNQISIFCFTIVGRVPCKMSEWKFNLRRDI